LSAGSTIFELAPQYSSTTLGTGSAISVGAGGNRPGVPAYRSGSGVSKSDYRAAEVDSGRFLSGGSWVWIPLGTPQSQPIVFPSKREYQVTIWLFIQSK